MALLVVLAGLGAGGGWAAASLDQPPPVDVGVAVPVPARSPSIPVESVAPYAADVDYPALGAGLRYRRETIGRPGYRWEFAAPQDWLVYPTGLGELRARPEDSPTGSYYLRVKLVAEGRTPDEMVSQKLAALESCCAEVTPIGRSNDTIAITFRSEPEDWLRYDIFRWFTSDDDDVADVEISVTGRERDRRGLDDLLDQVSASIRELGGTSRTGASRAGAR